MTGRCVPLDGIDEVSPELSILSKQQKNEERSACDHMVLIVHRMVGASSAPPPSWTRSIGVRTKLAEGIYQGQDLYISLIIDVMDEWFPSFRRQRRF